MLGLSSEIKIYSKDKVVSAIATMKVSVKEKLLYIQLHQSQSTKSQRPLELFIIFCSNNFHSQFKFLWSQFTELYLWKEKHTGIEEGTARSSFQHLRPRLVILSFKTKTYDSRIAVP